MNTMATVRFYTRREESATDHICTKTVALKATSPGPQGGCLQKLDTLARKNKNKSCKLWTARNVQGHFDPDFSAFISSHCLQQRF